MVKKNIDEIQGTAEEIALHKASQLEPGQFVDDTAVYIGPKRSIGPYIKFFSDFELVQNQAAEFVVTLSCRDEKGEIFVEHDSLFGKMVFPGRGNNGFGFDKYFEIKMSDGSRMTLAELTDEEKQSINPRKNALAKVLMYF